MPTGCGKTVVFSHIIQQWPNGRVLVLAHREELIRQAADKIHKVTGVAPAIEMAAERADMGMFHTDRVVVSSIQTQIAGPGERRRMQRFRPGDFSLVIVDEAHHAVSKSYRAVLAHYQQNPHCRVLGVTATPDRHDERALGQVFESVAFRYDLADAIRDGWLVPIRSSSVYIKDLDYSHIHSAAGDLNGAELAAVLEDERMAQEVALPIVAESRGRKTLVFAASVKHAEQLADIINRKAPNSARWICGKTDRETRRHLLRDYAEGRFRFLINVGVFTEGFDEPSIELIVLARPTKSRALFAQMVGRGTRPLPGIVDNIDSPQDRVTAIAHSPKASVEVLDYEGNCGRHKLITTADILGGVYDAEVVELAIRKAREKGRESDGEAVDVMANLEAARAEVEAEKVRDVHRRRNVLARVDYAKQAVDLFDALDLEPRRERDWDRSKPPSRKMIDLLERNGVAHPEALAHGQARQLVGEIIRRHREKRATFKQARLLKRFGYPTDCSFAQASATIDAIQKNGWRRPTTAPAEVAA
jgi:superfamily II DNA or RNA helicase